MNKNWNIKLLKNSTNLVNLRTLETQSGTKQIKTWKEIPGPKCYPLIKQALHFVPGIGAFRTMEPKQLGKYFHEKYGPIVRFEAFLGARPFVLLFDPAAIEIVLRAENIIPIRPGFDSLSYFRKKYNKIEEEKRPTGLLTEQGQNWKTFRSVVNPVMLQPKTIRLYESVLKEVSSEMIQKMKSIRDDKFMIPNFDLEMNKWSLECIGTVALGGRIGCLDSSLSEYSEAMQLIKCVEDIFMMSEKIDFKPGLWRYFPTKNFRVAMKLYQKQMDLSKHFIDRAIKNFKLSSRSEEQRGVLEKLLQIDERTALIMATDMLLAGVDTVATAIMNALYLLGTNIGKQKKLREEIKSTSQDKRPYLKACLKETYRMMPVVPGYVRQSTKEYELLGYTIPKGVNITFTHQYLSMLDEQYHKAKEFIPERWLVDKNDPLYYGKAHTFATSPFGFGARLCIGKRIAELELEIFLAKMVESFQVEWYGPPPKVVTSSINYIQKPFNFVFQDIK